jgi:hypothetical protein
MADTMGLSVVCQGVADLTLVPPSDSMNSAKWGSAS